MLKAVLLDISGVLYEDDEALPGAVAAVKTLQKRGLALRFVTNTSKRTCEAIYYDLKRMGFALSREQIYTAPAAVKDYVRQHELRPFCLLHENLEREFADVDQSHPNAVVVCDAERRFDYNNLNRAFHVLMEGAPLIAVGENRYYKSHGRFYLDAGPFVKALEYAAATEAIILGKPSKDFYHTALADLNVKPGEALMIGDDVEADVRGAMDAGLQAALVKTGKYRPGDEALAPKAGVYADLAEAVAAL